MNKDFSNKDGCFLYQVTSSSFGFHSSEKVCVIVVFINDDDDEMISITSLFSRRDEKPNIAFS